LAAATEAWESSGLEGHNIPPSKMGSILGVGIGGLETLESNAKALFDAGPRRVSPFLIPAMISNLAPGNIAIKLNLQGVNYTVTSACTSGTHALGEAMRMVQDGIQDVVLAGGAEAAITPLAVSGFARMKALSTRNDEPEKASRPFDKDRDGFVMGEGAAILVVESLESAERRGADIYAELVGYGVSCDAYHITSPAEGGDGAILSMKNALESAGMAPEELSYVNAHGTSTPINDPAESKAIKKVFGSYARIEGAFSVMAIKEGKVPPTINLDEPDPECDLDYVPKVAREVPVNSAMSNSFGFGGTNASVIFKRFA